MAKTTVAASGIRRKRDVILVDELIKAAAQSGGRLTEEVAHKALRAAWSRGGSTVKPGTALDIVKAKLKNPNIRMAVAEIYEDLGDFSVGDAIKKHVEHIEEGSYPALKDYIGMVLPTPAKKLEIGMVSPGFGGSLAAVPPVAARAIGPAVVEEIIPEATTVEFKEQEDGEATEDVDG